MLDPRGAHTIIAEELERLRQRIIANMRAQGAVASGRTIRSMRVVMTGDGGMLVSDQQMPFGTLETGRRGGATPFAFSEIIYQWMQDKGIHGTPMPYKTNRPHKYTAQERGDRSMAAAVAHTIRTSGSRLYRVGGRDTIYSNEIPDTVERIESKVTGLISAYADEMIKLNNVTIGE